MKIFAFIPARYQSTRFPGKPLALIAGRPMIQRVYERAILCREFSEVYVASDDERIAECVRGFGGNIVMSEQSHNSGTDRICEAALKMGLEKGDLVVNIQGDQPLFEPSIVTQLIDPLVNDISVSMTTLKWKFTDNEDAVNPNHVKVVTDSQGFALYFSRHTIPCFRDDESEKIYYKHLGFYGFRMEFLTQFTHLPEGRLESAEKLEQLRALENGFRIKVLETTFNSIEVDTPEDARRAEEILRGSNSGI